MPISPLPCHFTSLFFPPHHKLVTAIFATFTWLNNTWIHLLKQTSTMISQAISTTEKKIADEETLAQLKARVIASLKTQRLASNSDTKVGRAGPATHGEHVGFQTHSNKACNRPIATAGRPDKTSSSDELKNNMPLPEESPQRMLANMVASSVFQRQEKNLPELGQSAVLAPKSHASKSSLFGKAPVKLSADSEACKSPSQAQMHTASRQSDLVIPNLVTKNSQTKDGSTVPVKNKGTNDAVTKNIAKTHVLNVSLPETSMSVGQAIAQHDSAPDTDPFQEPSVYTIPAATTKPTITPWIKDTKAIPKTPFNKMDPPSSAVVSSAKAQSGSDKSPTRSAHSSAQNKAVGMASTPKNASGFRSQLDSSPVKARVNWHLSPSPKLRSKVNGKKQPASLMSRTTVRQPHRPERAHRPQPRPNPYDLSEIIARDPDYVLSELIARDHDLRDWLKFTGWHEPYRMRELNRKRALDELEREKDRIMKASQRDKLEATESRVFDDSGRGAFARANFDFEVSARDNAGRELFHIDDSPTRRDHSRFPLPSHKRRYSASLEEGEIRSPAPRKVPRVDSPGYQRRPDSYRGSSMRGGVFDDGRGHEQSPNKMMSEYLHIPRQMICTPMSIPFQT